MHIPTAPWELPHKSPQLERILALGRMYWPGMRFFDKQQEMIDSAATVKETVITAANQVGKDYTASFVSLTFFLAPWLYFPPEYFQEVESQRQSPEQPEWQLHTRRIVTTSVDGDQLRNLWGEISRLLSSSRFPLLDTRGGPLVVNQRDISLVAERGETKEPLNYLIGRVSATGEGISGAHAAYNLMLIDEASGSEDAIYEFAQGWAKKFFIFGNPNETGNFFKRMVKGGNTPNRRIIKIRAADSPNVRSGRRIFAGVLTKEEYEYRRKELDAVRQCVGLDAEFYEGSELLMFPPAWLNLAEERAERLKGLHRQGRAIGVDVGEGSADTSICVVDGRGVLDLESLKTPNTAVIPGLVLAKARKWHVPFEKIVFDAGGGGKQIVDPMREEGFPVRAVGFGSAPRLPIKHGLTTVAERIDVQEEKAAYVCLRDQMYWEARELLNPEGGEWAFAIPRQYAELRRQLQAIPLTYDKHGRVKLIPKRIDPARPEADSLEKRLGRSPDDADSFVLGVHGLLHRESVSVAGVIG